MTRNQMYVILPGLVLALLAVAGCPGELGTGPGRPGSSAAPLTTPVDSGGPMRPDTAGRIADHVVASLPTETSEDQQVRQTIRATVMDLLTSGNRETRIEAARDLGESRHKPAAEALLLAAEEDDAGVRAEAIRAVGQLGDASQAGVIAARLRDPSEPVRIAAAEALGRLRQRTTADALAQACGDSSPQVRAAAVRALGWLRLPASVPTLTKSLADTDPTVRAASAASLGLTGSSAAVAPLSGALADGHALVRYQSVNALAALNATTARAAIGRLSASDPDASVRTAARLALDRIRP